MVRFLHVTSVEHVSGFRIRVAFNDGRQGIVDLQPYLDGPVFEPLRDPRRFADFQLAGHTVAWPNGADFAPEFLHELLEPR